MEGKEEREREREGIEGDLLGELQIVNANDSMEGVHNQVISLVSSLVLSPEMDSISLL